MHYFDGGNCIGRFQLATNEVYINKTTNEKSLLKRAQQSGRNLRKHLSKGDKIYVEGRIKSRQWQTEDGTTKHTSEIQVTEFTFVYKKATKTTNKLTVLNPQKH
jgi:single-strand DNA-binding protein